MTSSVSSFLVALAEDPALVTSFRQSPADTMTSFGLDDVQQQEALVLFNQLNSVSSHLEVIDVSNNREFFLYTRDSTRNEDVTYASAVYGDVNHVVGAELDMTFAEDGNQVYECILSKLLGVVNGFTTAGGGPVEYVDKNFYLLPDDEVTVVFSVFTMSGSPLEVAQVGVDGDYDILTPVGTVPDLVFRDESDVYKTEYLFSISELQLFRKQTPLT